MSLPHALLIALIEDPRSGSELSSRFDRSIGLYWQASHQQIYRELARLEAAGWIEATPVERGRGRKKNYRVVAAGRQALRRWVAAPRELEPYRSELMIRVHVEATIGPSGLATQIERRLEMHRARLTTYQRIEKRAFSTPDPSRTEAISHLILKLGMMNESTWIDWSVEALGVLGQRAATKPVS